LIDKLKKLNHPRISMQEVMIVMLALCFFLLLYFLFTNPILVYFLLLAVILWAFFTFFVKKYDEYERAVIFRLGRFNRIAGPGWSIVIPFFEKEFARLDVRTKMLSLNIPQAFTKDDLRLAISGFIYYRIVDPSKAVLRVENYQFAITNLIQSETRNVIGSLYMREVFANLDKLNDMIAERVRLATWKWGIDVSSVQIRSVSPPEEVAIAMQEKFVRAELLQAAKFRAEARKVAIEAIGEAATKLDDRAIMYLYIKALEEISKGTATKIIFPLQFFDVLRDMEKDIGKALAGLNVGALVNAMKDKILEATK